MADLKDEETRRAGMVKALEKGIKQADGTISDKEAEKLSAASKALNAAKKAKKQAAAAAADLLPGVGKKVQGAISKREQQLLDAEQ